MAKSKLVTHPATGQPTGNTTYYLSVGGGETTTYITTEAAREMTTQDAFTLSNLEVHVSLNSATSTSTFRTRKNRANGNQSVSISASATGLFEDDTNTDSYSAGDEYNFQIATGTGSVGLELRKIGVIMDASSNTLKHFTGYQIGFTTNSVTRYFGLTDAATAIQSTEANTETTFKDSGTMQDLQFNAVTNTRSTACTGRLRKNRANGNQSVSITATTTGIFQDTTNTDTVASNDEINFSITTGTGGNNIQCIAGVDCVTTNSKYTSAANMSSGQTINANVTTSVRVLSHGGSSGSTEDTISPELDHAGTATNLGIYVSANTVSATSTLTARKNEADTSLAASITASTTGWFFDTSNSATYVATDRIGTRLVTGSTGTSLTYRATSLLIENTDAAGGSALFGFISQGYIPYLK